MSIDLGSSYYERYPNQAPDVESKEFFAQFVGDNPEERINMALNMLIQFSQIDGSHHKAWSIDQVTRILAGEKYEDLVKWYEGDEESDEYYTWDKGVGA